MDYPIDFMNYPACVYANPTTSANPVNRIRMSPSDTYTTSNVDAVVLSSGVFFSEITCNSSAT